ncbi:hypothetical protein [Polyangium fumosum]|uniref:Uncharacterized protein n=1 Tax=Polyangium fumosum TaxID=889272 RepID=A0A4U1IZT6_9BACT|nr:hypothetical protein [Polyangium fumosum]TKC99606.1 hypothetical protein E8A74_37540 [Polyangium fumosum]
MDATLTTLLTLYVFSTGRRLFAMQEVKKAASAAGHAALAAHCDVAIDHDRMTRNLEARWSSDKDAAQYSPETKQIDILVDVALGAFRDAINAEARDSAPGDTLGEDAAKLEAELFPKGVAAITTLPFPEELAEVERIISRAQSPQWSNVTQALGLGRRVARLVELEKSYRAAIAAPAKNVSFGQVKNARAKGQSLMLQAVAMILGLHPSDSEADLLARQNLLGPILAQNEAIRVYLRARRTIEDIDPETGQVEATRPATQTTTDPAGGPVG